MVCNKSFQIKPYSKTEALLMLVLGVFFPCYLYVQVRNEGPCLKFQRAMIKKKILQHFPKRPVIQLSTVTNNIQKQHS